MEKSIEFIITGLLSIFISVISIPLLREIAIKVQLVDKPNHRKIHTDMVPLIGGVAIALSAFMTMFVNKDFTNIISENVSMLSCALVILVMGVLDDKYDLDAKLKLTVQLACAFAIAFSGIRITSLYGFWGIHQLPEYMQYIITIILITGLVNSFNLMDGVDGLAGSLTVLGFVLFFVLNILQGDYHQALICIAIAGSTLVFLKHNFAKKKIFMGDAGSLTFGFMLSSIGIQMIEKVQIETHPDQTFILSVILAFFAIPTLDSLRVYKGRIKIGKSPFQADKTHLHHLFLNIGVSAKNIAFYVVFIVLIYLFIVLKFNDLISLTLIVSFVVSSFTLMARMLNMMKDLNIWKEKIAEMESAE